MSSPIFEIAALLWSQMKDDWTDVLEADYRRAEESTNSCLLTAEAIRCGVDSFSLFTGPAARAYRFASEELLAHWESHPRRSREEFEQQWIAARGGF